MTNKLAVTNLALTMRTLQSMSANALLDLRNGAHPLPVAGAVSGWLKTNYLPSKRTGGLALQNVLFHLRENKQYTRHADFIIQGVKFNIFKGKTPSSIKQLKLICEHASKILMVAGDRAASEVCLKALKNLVAISECMAAALHGERPKTKKPKVESLQGSQRTQSEKMFNEILATLPKHLADDLRYNLRHCDNKLAELKKFLK